MVAKRTLREIRRMSELTNVILETAKRLGPGNGRHASFMSALGRITEFKRLPSWRRAYLQGYAEGASAILELDAAGLLAGPVAAKEIEKVEKLDRLPPRLPMQRVRARAATVVETEVSTEEPEIDAKAMAWLARALQKLAATATEIPTATVVSKSQPPGKAR